MAPATIASGSAHSGALPRFWGEPAASYFENVMIARAVKNAIYFASVNYALRYQQTATSLVAPDGRCVVHTAYSEEALRVVDLDPGAATGSYARRYAPERYGE
jgi:predicted amidohydrolase